MCKHKFVRVHLIFIIFNLNRSQIIISSKPLKHLNLVEIYCDFRYDVSLRKSKNKK